MGFISFHAPGTADRRGGREPAPGRDLAEQLMQSVAALGYRILEVVTEHDAYGWSFTVETAHPRPIWCMLQLSDEWLLITHTHTPLLRKLLGTPAISDEHAQFDAALLRVLASIRHVSNVRWFRTADDFRHRRFGQP